MKKLIVIIAVIAIIINGNNMGLFGDILNNILYASAEKAEAHVKKYEETQLVNELVKVVSDANIEQLANSSEPALREMAEAYYANQFSQVQELYDQLRAVSSLSDTELPDINIVEELMKGDTSTINPAEYEMYEFYTDMGGEESEQFADGVTYDIEQNFIDYTLSIDYGSELTEDELVQYLDGLATEDVRELYDIILTYDDLYLHETFNFDLYLLANGTYFQIFESYFMGSF